MWLWRMSISRRRISEIRPPPRPEVEATVAIHADELRPRLTQLFEHPLAAGIGGEAGRAERRLESINVEPLRDLARELLGASMCADAVGHGQHSQPSVQMALGHFLSSSLANRDDDEPGPRTVTGPTEGRSTEFGDSGRCTRARPNLLSTAGSFSPPLGSRIDPRGVDGYYIDFTLKADSTDWPPSWLPHATVVHIPLAQYGLGCVERYLAGEGDMWLDAAITVSDYLLDDQGPDGGWAHREPMPHSYWLRPPWLSAMAQGEAASLLVRVHQQTGETRYAEAAVKALGPMHVPVAEGGVRAELGGGFFPEEYPTEPGSFVLNGAIFALWGCRDVAVGLGDSGAAELYAAGVETLAANLDRWDTGSWSRYDLFPHPIRNTASGAYHLLHVRQLEALNRITPRPEFAATADRWASYRASPLRQTRATAEKVAFRLVVPRSKRLAMRLPWSHRPDHGELLVLCYHSVSDSWPSRLAVGREQLRDQLGGLVRQGYEGATFTDAVTTPSSGQASRGHIRRRLRGAGSKRRSRAGGSRAAGDGVRANGLSRPRADALAGHRAMARHTAPGRARGLSWEQLRRMSELGWEVGSHGCSHPRLTQLDDNELTRELGESRVELEHQIGSPADRSPTRTATSTSA